MTPILSGRAAAFLALHVPGEPLLQPNAWDVGSALVLESLGFNAVGHDEQRLCRRCRASRWCDVKR